MVKIHRLIIVTGMPGAGKSELAHILKTEYNVPSIVMGDVIRDEAKRRGLAPTPLTTKKIMLELREIEGPGAVAKRCISYLNQIESETVVIEGCRSLSEVEVFSAYCNEIIIVSIHSSPKTRFSRLLARKRTDVPPDYDTFRERDLRELSIGLGNVIALSDIMIVNEGTLDELHSTIHSVAKRLIKQ